MTTKPTIESKILSNLVTNEEFVRRVLPYLKEEYFHEAADKAAYKLIATFIDQHNARPTKDVLLIELDQTKLPEEIFNSTSALINALDDRPEQNIKWLVDSAESFCRDKAIMNGMMESISIMSGKSKLDKGAIPKILQDAIAVSFDNNIGHDFVADARNRFEYYHREESKHPTGVDIIDRITHGGVLTKSLNVILGGIHVGKSLWLCSLAANSLLQNKNVLYITCEMAQEQIAQRIDANLLNVDINDIPSLPDTYFMNAVEKINKKTRGRLIIKEYPVATATSNHIRSLLNELKLKKEFVPDIVYVDYLNICASIRYKAGSQNASTYVVGKAISEELRALAQENDFPLWTATQMTRAGFSNSDPGMDDTAESWGLPQTADFMIAVTQSEELERAGLYAVKQLKNRYGNVNYLNRFVVGVDKTRMRIFDPEPAAQKAVMPITEFENFMKNETSNVSPIGEEKARDREAIFG